MRRLYDETIILAEKLTAGILESIVYLYKVTLQFIALLIFGFLLVMMWSLILGIPCLIVWSVIEGLL